MQPGVIFFYRHKLDDASVQIRNLEWLWVWLNQSLACQDSSKAIKTKVEWAESHFLCSKGAGNTLGYCRQISKSRESISQTTHHYFAALPPVPEGRSSLSLQDHSIQPVIFPGLR
ncbi:uncharacterized protein LOC143653513 [Tamandua tetradactyla]|uniref:uncharacterized protein LOC143653513 n=1 Tax=Tamandua tetradactyla TaxID=48850 RepID=UPI004053AC25